MSEILSSVPTSRRGYLSQAELQQFADITITDQAEADDRISQAEEIVDSFVGPQDQFYARSFSNIVEGKAQAGGSGQLTLESRHSSVFLVNFFTGCELEIIGGSGAGQRTIIATNTYPNSIVTFRDTLTTPADNTSFYRIYQLGKFPRKRDVYLDSINPSVPTYYKNIPEEVKRAVAAQVEYMISMGDDFFKGDDIFKNSEHMGDYSYTKDRSGAGSGIPQLIAPKAKMLLRGFLNRKGIMLV